MSNFLPDILTGWLYNEVFTAAELADAAECSASTLYKYAEAERRCPFDRARRIARYASERGHNELAGALLSPAYEVRGRPKAEANGCLNDELAPMTEALGIARLAHRTGDREEMTEQIAEAEKLLHRLKAERDRL